MSLLINIQPVEIIGECPVGLKLTDMIQVEDLKIMNPQHLDLCFLAISHLPVVIWRLQSNRSFFAHSSCPGCSSSLEEENRVIFLLGQSDKWTLCRDISEYRRLCRSREESEAARSLKESAIALQSKGEFVEAAAQMRMALEALQRSVALK